MRLISYGKDRLSDAEGAVAALGNFDGVHKGHQALIAEAARFAQGLAAPLGAAVFEPHPRRFFQADAPPFLLMRVSDKARLLNDLGCDPIFVLPFDAAMAALTPEAFVRDVLVDGLKLKGVVVGGEFRFGARRAGGVDALKALGASAGLAVHIVEPRSARDNEDKYSSTDVRAALRNGDPKRAADILGRPWFVEGVVSEGDKRGRTIGFPTANIWLGDLVEPRYGVYAVTVNVEGALYAGVANFGRRPTVKGDAPRLEVHLFGFDGDLYGKTAAVAFYDFLRPEQAFDGLDALQEQIKKDAAKARRLADAVLSPS
ncbi:MAG: bifunctional riboflavin kinase/FAD synthetase [Pseudomonadota bacterium]